MKSIKILASALILTFATVGNAQETVKQPESKSFSFGVKGGLNVSTVVGGEDTLASRNSFHAGLFGELPITDKFSLQLEALYSGQGYELGFEGSDNDRAEVQLDYINVPILARIYVFECLSIDAGPQLSYLINDEFDLNPNSNNGDSDLGIYEPNKFDVGLAGGLTFETKFGLFATGRYTYGLTKLYDTGNGGDIAFDGFHNQVGQISLGYKF